MKRTQPQPGNKSQQQEQNKPVPGASTAIHLGHGIRDTPAKTHKSSI